MAEVSISRIIAAVGPGKTPKHFDRDELRQNIEAAWHSYQSDVDESTGRGRHQQSAQAARIVRLAGELLDRLEDPRLLNPIDTISIRFPVCEGVPLMDAERENGPGGPMYRADDPGESVSDHTIEAAIKRVRAGVKAQAIKPDAP
jgi:hypothetical protein